MILSFRGLNALGAGLCVFSLLFAWLFLERALGLEPCPLCMFDRVVIGVAAVLFALGALVNPARAWVRRVHAGVTGAVLLGGVAIGVRHVWLQQLPAEDVPACGPSFDYMFDVFPFFEALAMIFQGSGSCAEVDAHFLGVTLAQWTLVLFVALALIPLWLLVRPRGYGG